MVASSAPLVLWSPSSVLIGSEDCSIGPKQFLRLVDSGAIRILGRSEWLTDSKFRNNHKWEGARWVPEIDNVLRKFALDSTDSGAGRHVTIINDELGDKWAPNYVEQHPELIGEIHGALTAEGAEHRFPLGVVEKAKRTPDPVKHVITVVRDIYNHDAALADSGTKTPFLLAPRESAFHQLVERVRTDSPIRYPEFPLAPSLTPGDLAQLTDDVLTILRHLENGRRTNLDKFLAGSGHAALTMWMQEICASLEQSGARSVRGELAAQLREDFDASQLGDESGSWSDSNLEASLVVDEVTGKLLTVWSKVGLAQATIPLGTPLGQRFGLAPAEVKGTCPWAFLYAFGRQEANPLDRAEMWRTVDRLRFR
jgi:hypothetical protein